MWTFKLVSSSDEELLSKLLKVYFGSCWLLHSHSAVLQDSNDHYPGKPRYYVPH